MSKSITVPFLLSGMPAERKPVSLQQLESLSRQLNSSLDLETILDILPQGMRELLGTARRAVSGRPSDRRGDLRASLGRIL